MVTAYPCDCETDREGNRREGTMYVDDRAVDFGAVADSFVVPVRLGAGEHSIVACADVGELSLSQNYPNPFKHETCRRVNTRSDLRRMDWRQERTSTVSRIKAESHPG